MSEIRYDNAEFLHAVSRIREEERAGDWRRNLNRTSNLLRRLAPWMGGLLAIMVILVGSLLIAGLCNGMPWPEVFANLVYTGAAFLLMLALVAGTTILGAPFTTEDDEAS